MAQENRNRLAEWLVLLRQQAPVVRRQFSGWLESVREEPALFWQTVAVRYVAYGLAGLALVWAVSAFSRMIVPPPHASAKPAATTADFHVVCSNRQCLHHYVIHRKFGFRGFPVRCPRCEQKTGMQARRCNSPICQGRWVPAQERDGRTYCPECNQPIE